ncbi:MAG: hypothetical protein A3K67_01585 [Euryarchaeota archaeon RBG_16_62_10]|nr:MAG: hypothetical protein A3K67_01585 [Euryarchaeota archaeon RBG_16_62_10]
MSSNALRALAMAVLALLFVAIVLSVPWPEGDMDSTTSEDVAKTLFGTTGAEGYGLVLLLIGLLLLVALLGGIFLAKEESE